jgi:hypothetical protein
VECNVYPNDGVAGFDGHVPGDEACACDCVGMYGTESWPGRQQSQNPKQKRSSEGFHRFSFFHCFCIATA